MIPEMTVTKGIDWQRVGTDGGWLDLDERVGHEHLPAL